MNTMNAGQRAKRQTILREINSILEGWGESTESGSMLRMEASIGALETLANDVDDTCTDRLERARNWRYVGNAYFDLSARAGLERLEMASAAYKRAEVLLAGIDAPAEKMLLDYSHGHALLGLSRRSDLWLVEEARHKYSAALEIAEKEMPDAVGPISSALSSTDQIIAVLHKRQEIYRQIAALKRMSLTHEAHDGSNAETIEDSHLFELLIANYNEAAQVCSDREPNRLILDWSLRSV